MVRITSIEIDGFITPSQKVKLDLLDSNVVCIYGDNGSGKTSFLEILFAIFDRDGEKLEKYEVNSIFLECKNDTTKLELEIESLKLQEEQLNLKLEKEYVKFSTIEDEGEREKYKHNIIVPIEQDINSCQYEVVENLKLIEEASQIVQIKSDIDDEGKKFYDFESLEESKVNNASSLFLGIGRGIHKKELDISRQTLWHFFRGNKKISEDKILTGNEIDDFTDKLVKHLENANLIESDKAKALDNKKNIYLPHIEIDTIEAFLMNKYQEAVLDAKEKIEKALYRTSLNSFKFNSNGVKSIDLDALKERLIYNKALLIEMFARDEDMGIGEVFSGLERSEKFLEQIDTYQQMILFTIIQELQSEVELFKEIQIFLDEYNSFLNYDKNLVLSSNGIFVTPENHFIERLSSGERHLLTFLATILLMGEEQEFILLDEPEISLNVDWQRKILSTIEKLAPDAQVIVATHSPLVVEEYPQSLIKIEPERL